MQAAAIVTQGLTCRFGAKAAVDDVDLHVPRGAVFGFLGPNGAGKTTTIRLLLGLARPQRGRIEIFGMAMPEQRTAILGGIGAMVEMPAHYDHLTGLENLDITRRLLGGTRADMGRVLAIVALEDAAHEKVAGYSLGMRQRLGIARALLGRPRLLILDEPTNGLDPDGIRDVRALLRRLPSEEGCTVMMSSHLLAEVEHTATHIGMMWRGRLVAQGPLRDVLKVEASVIEVDVDRREAATCVLASTGISFSSPGANRIEVQGKVAPAEVNALLTGAGIAVSRLAYRETSLEDLYVGLSRRERLVEAYQ